MLSRDSLNDVVAPTKGASDAFARIADDLREESGVQVGTGFSSDPGLRAFGKVFAILKGQEMVVRLSASRTTELVRTHAATRFYDSEDARLLLWVALPQSKPDGWINAAKEALEFARADA